MLIPIGVVHATITGTPVLGVANKSGTPAPTLFTPVTTSVDVIAGTSSVGPIATGCDGGVCAYTPSFFGINFNGVSFSGAQFYLYISENGFANVNTSAGDIKYAGPFSASSLTGAGALVAAGLAPGIVGANYWIGSPGAGEDLVVGPIPVEISTAYQYIKVYDGSCGTNPTFCGGTGVAGAKQLINVQPGITIDVTKGPAWTSVHVSGGGFAKNALVNINGTFTTFEWTTGAASMHKVYVTTAISTGAGGWFGPVLMSMTDDGQGYNAFGGPYLITPITLSATNDSSIKVERVLLNVAQNGINPPIFNEYNRVFNQVVSYFSGVVEKFDVYGTYGNSTGLLGGVAPYLPNQPIPVYITGTLGIVGTNFTVSGSTSIWIGAVQLVGSPVTDSASGHWVANVTIPDLPQGPNTVEVLNNGVRYYFAIVVEPTLILTPNTGPTASNAPTGDVVTVTAYGFPSNKWVSLWWNEYSLGDGNDYFLLNATIDSAGSYNKTITFEVPPEVYGGAHEIQATTANWPTPTLETSIVGSGYVTEAAFTVTPTLVITPNVVNSNQQGWFFVEGTGFNPTKLYYVNLDNALSFSGAPGMEPALDGGMNINFTTAGFNPGVHQIEVFDWTDNLGSGAYAPVAWTYFNVTLTGDFEANAIASLQTSLTGIQTSLTAVQTSLTSVQTSLTSITNSLTSIQSSLTGITSSLTGITSSLTSITSSLTGITSSLTSIQGSLTTITGDVSGLGSQLTSLQQSASSLQSSASSLSTAVGNLGTQLTGISGTLTSMQGTLTTISGYASTAATQATNGASSAANAVTDSSTAETYVLVVAVLAAITLVLELAILVRKLS